MGRRQFLSNQSKMALSKWYKITSVINLVPTTCLSRTFKCEPLNTLQHRQYSRYPSHYIEPVYELDKLEGLFQSGEAQQNAFLPIKAARNDNNTSVFYDEVTSKFINTLMKKGDRVTARNLVEQAFVQIKKIQFSKYHQAETDAEREQIILNPVTVLHNAIDNCMLILQSNEKERKVHFPEKLAAELIDASNNTGRVVK